MAHRAEVLRSRCWRLLRVRRHAAPRHALNQAHHSPPPSTAAPAPPLHLPTTAALGSCADLGLPQCHCCCRRHRHCGRGRLSRHCPRCLLLPPLLPPMHPRCAWDCATSRLSGKLPLLPVAAGFSCSNSAECLTERTRVRSERQVEERTQIVSRVLLNAAVRGETGISG